MEIKQKKRDEIPNEFKWNLEDLYPTPEDWRKDVDSLPASIDEITAFQGKLTTGKALAECADIYFTTSEKTSRIYSYAMMKLHEDSNISASQGMSIIAESESTKFYAASSFIIPEILTHDEKTILDFINTTPELKIYEHFLKNLLREKAHIRSAEVEEVLANASEVGNSSSNIYDMLCSADMKFGKIQDAEDNTVEITHGNFITLMQSPDRRVRRDAFTTYYSVYQALENTIATMLSSSIKKDMFYAKARNYTNTLEAELSDSNIPRKVYEELIKTVHEYLPAMHRYTALRKKALKLDELHMYDVYTPLVEEADIKISYQEAKEKVAVGLVSLGDEYVSAMVKGMESGWIDVYENEGKESGAYALNAYGVHPYVLLNHEDTLSDMLTLAHEMGHAMHDYYTCENQPYVYGHPNIFLAEVASTVNETLLMEYMIKTTEDHKTRTYLLGEYLEQFRGTIYRQVMFAEFEMITHSMAEQGEPLTLETLKNVYRELNVKYYGPDMIIDEEIDLEWARIPHFYSAFYVYQYATGYSAALAFAKRIQMGGEKARDDYLGFLKAGGSDYAIEILKKAGVDMSTPEPVRAALQVFEELVGEMEKALI
ncbi:MAG: oligoendopeptidase F [Defluviitaleaceae bacterium]|nr:oligoendopeptidase F [Defluviitaleaceae bacterium]